MTALTDRWWLPGELGKGFWSLVWETDDVTDCCYLLWHQREEQGLCHKCARPVLFRLCAVGLCLLDLCN